MLLKVQKDLTLASKSDACGVAHERDEGRDSLCWYWGDQEYRAFSAMLGGSSFWLMAYWLAFILSSLCRDMFEVEWDGKQTCPCSQHNLGLDSSCVSWMQTQNKVLVVDTR